MHASLGCMFVAAAAGPQVSKFAMCACFFVCLFVCVLVCWFCDALSTSYIHMCVHTNLWLHMCMHLYTYMYIFFHGHVRFTEQKTLTSETEVRGKSRRLLGEVSGPFWHPGVPQRCPKDARARKSLEAGLEDPLPETQLGDQIRTFCRFCVSFFLWFLLNVVLEGLRVKF